MGAEGTALVYVSLPALIELKLAAGRIGDEHDVAELIRANPAEVAAIREHLLTIHRDYVRAFDALVVRAGEQIER